MVIGGLQIIVIAYKSWKQCEALMAHEDLKLCEMRVPPQKNDELSGLRLKATANGNRSGGKSFTESAFLRIKMCSLLRAGFPLTIGLGRGDDFDTLIIDVKSHQVNNA